MGVSDVVPCVLPFNGVSAHKRCATCGVREQRHDQFSRISWTSHPRAAFRHSVLKAAFIGGRIPEGRKLHASGRVPNVRKLL